MSQPEVLKSSDASRLTDTKRHASCDECRARKMKCSGEVTGCARCLRERITCHYSEQKQMGRPRKRRRNVDEDTNNNLPSRIIDDIPQPEQDTLDVLLGDLQGSNPTGSDSFDLMNMPFPNSFYDESTTLNAMGLDDTADTADNSYQDSPGHSSNTSQISCACLDTLYLTLSSLQPYAASSKTLMFPLPLLPMRKAIGTGYSVLRCPRCPSVFASSMQNLMLLGTLLQLLAVCFSNMLQSIDREAAALSAERGKRKFRMGDMSDGTAGMHTGTLDCPMAFEVELTASEWRTMAKKVVLHDLRGPDGKGGLMGLLNSMEERQKERHRSQSRYEDGNEVACKLMSQVAPPNGDYTCLRIMDHARKVIEAVDID
ncbi:MAG: hypothetical protein M1836_003295 [Candelina mexicana]|nr:MAG: hypothetical protein M1836_003295 [Candelina mexicana]